MSTNATDSHCAKIRAQQQGVEYLRVSCRFPGIPTTMKTTDVNITTIAYLRVLIIGIGSTIILMVVEAQGFHDGDVCFMIVSPHSTPSPLRISHLHRQGSGCIYSQDADSRRLRFLIFKTWECFDQKTIDVG